MYEFAILTFLGILTFTYGAPSESFNGCLNVTAIGKFEPKRFFTGRWYLTHIEKSYVTSTDVCQESNSNITEDGTINHVIYAYTKPEYLQVDCKANVKDIKDGLGKVLFTCKFNIDGKDIDYFLPATIAETDYDNFAVFYTCSKDVGENKASGNFIILNRDINGEPTDPKIATTLKKYGLDVNTFDARKNVKCKELPKSLNN